MSKFNFPNLRTAGLRVRILFLLVAGIIPGVAADFWLSWRGAKLAENAASQEVQRIATEIANDYRENIRVTREALTQAAGARAVYDAEMPRCKEVFSRIIAQQPWLTGAWVTDALGIQKCSEQGNLIFDRSDRPDFIEAIRSGAFAVGQYRVGQATGRYVVPVSMPVVNDDGRITGTVGASIDMAWSTIQQSKHATFANTLFSILDANNIVLYRSIDAERFVGKPAPAGLTNFPPGVDTMTFHSPASFDGIARIFYVIRLYNPDITIRVGVPTANYMSPIEAQLEASILIRALTALLTGLFIYWGLKRFVTKPVEELRMAADKAELGQLLALPAFVEKAPGEIGALARSISSMSRKLMLAGQQFTAMMDNTVDGMITIDHRGSVTAFSKPAESIFGYKAREVIGKNVSMLMPEPHRSAYDRYLGAYTETGVAKVIGIGRELVGQRKDGSLFQLDLSVNELPSASGPRQFVGTVRDITQRKALEGQLQQSQKMEAIGQLTGGIAHDFNNQLSVIIGNLELAKTRLPEDAQLERFMDRALTGANRSAELTRSLLAFARQQQLSPKICSVNGCISEAVHLLDRILGEDIEVVVHTDQHAWSVLVDEAQLISCVLNLATNARDAMPEGGTLTIVVSNAEAGKDEGLRALDLPFGEYVSIEISDTGAGMTPETLAKVFEPFFTTKEVGKGTGLGLSMVHGFVHQSGGHIAIRSEVGQGTAVQIYLPRVEERRAASASGPGAPEPRPLGKATVLMVEDNEGVRQVVMTQLESLGYRVIEAADGPSALVVLDDSDQDIDLLFTDVVMPGKMDGYALAGEAAKRRPGLKVLLTSGYPGKTSQGGGERRQRLLTKPYSLTALATEVAAVLDAHG